MSGTNYDQREIETDKIDELSSVILRDYFKKAIIYLVIIEIFKYL